MIEVRVGSSFRPIQLFERVERGRQRSLMRAGALVRTIARRSIRRRRRPSNPGQPPSSHSGELRMILFGYDDATGGVVVGPRRLGGLTTRGGEVPSLHEFGGVVTRNGRLLRYARRPYMAPAMERAAESMPELFRDLVGV